MEIPAKISFHNMDHSAALQARIEEKIEKLAKRFGQIVKCQVRVEAAHHHQNKGRLYSMLIDVFLPQGEVVVSHHPGRNPDKHEKAFAAMNNAFQAVVKKLERYKDERHRDVKIRESHMVEGVVSNIFHVDDYGFITTQENGEVYFHKNAVQNDKFDTIDIGSRVKFVLASDEGRKGPQASMVRPLK